MPLETTLDLRVRALATLMEETAAAVGRLVAAVDGLIRRTEVERARFDQFVAEHPELASAKIGAAWDLRR